LWRTELNVHFMRRNVWIFNSLKISKLSKISHGI
jgi:hypothetical protein